MEDLRTWLYPLGFLSAFVFGFRLLLQWFQSEKAQESIVRPSFWRLSLLGNILLFLHSFVQIQFHVCVVQACNAIISWRNLNLMQTRKPPISFFSMIILLIAGVFLTIFLFGIQDRLLSSSNNWLRIPTAPWQNQPLNSIPFFWHIVGGFSYFLFSSRSWVQWLEAEKAGTGLLPLSFWWISLIGALFSVAYFNYISDSVNLIGPAIGIIPYTRNLIMIYRSKVVCGK